MHYAVILFVPNCLARFAGRKSTLPIKNLATSPLGLETRSGLGFSIDSSSCLLVCGICTCLFPPFFSQIVPSEVGQMLGPCRLPMVA